MCDGLLEQSAAGSVVVRDVRQPESFDAVRVTEGEIDSPSPLQICGQTADEDVIVRGHCDYARSTSTTAALERLARLQPSMLACQHGSAYRGDGAALLGELAATIAKGSEPSTTHA